MRSGEVGPWERGVESKARFIQLERDSTRFEEESAYRRIPTKIHPHHRPPFPLQLPRQLYTLLQILLSHPNIHRNDQPTLALPVSLPCIPLVHHAQDGFQVGPTSESGLGVGARRGSKFEVGAGGGGGWEEEGTEDGEGDGSDGGGRGGQVVDRWEEGEEAERERD